MAEHIDAGELAEADVGLLAEPRAAEVAAHLETCPQCAGTAADLAEVRALLAGLPTPEMPASVADRLDRVIADEQTRRSSKPDPVGDPHGTHGTGALGPDHTGSLGSGSSGNLGSQSGGALGSDGTGTLGSDGTGALGSNGTGTLGSDGTGALGSGSSGALGSESVEKHGVKRLLVALGALVVVAGLAIGGYVATGIAGLNEPPAAAATAVTPGQLAELAATIQNRTDVDPHRFSRAWLCARKVTDGRITGLARVTVDGKSALLVYLREADVDSVVVVTGCDSGTPSPAASTTLPR